MHYLVKHILFFQLAGSSKDQMYSTSARVDVQPRKSPNVWKQPDGTRAEFSTLAGQEFNGGTFLNEQDYEGIKNFDLFTLGIYIFFKSKCSGNRTNFHFYMV